MIRFHLERQEPFVLWPFCNVNSVCWYGDSVFFLPPFPRPNPTPTPVVIVLCFFFLFSFFIINRTEWILYKLSFRDCIKVFYSSPCLRFSALSVPVIDSRFWFVFPSLPLRIALTSFVFLSWGVYGVLACLCAIYVELIGANCDIRFFLLLFSSFFLTLAESSERRGWSKDLYCRLKSRDVVIQLYVQTLKSKYIVVQLYVQVIVVHL